MLSRLDNHDYRDERPQGETGVIDEDSAIRWSEVDIVLK
jgi:hypothetical protein